MTVVTDGHSPHDTEKDGFSHCTENKRGYYRANLVNKEISIHHEISLFPPLSFVDIFRIRYD